MPRKTGRQLKSSKIKAGLIEARCCLQELAARLEWACSPKNYLDFERYQELKHRKFTREQREYLYYLKRKKLIETQKIGQRLTVRLTEKGLTEALRDKIKATKPTYKGNYCFVIFDIPEKERSARNLLRSFLKECGFIKLQHSVWMTNKEVVEPLRQLLQRKKLERWIRIVVGNIVAASSLDRLVIRHNYRG